MKSKGGEGMKSKIKILLTILSVIAIFLPYSLTAADNNHSDAPAAKEHKADPEHLYKQALQLINVPENERDYPRAAELLLQAAEAGHAEAQYSLALRYILGQGVSKDFQEAVKWLEKAATQGLADAQYSLGLRYQLGQNVPQNNAKAKNGSRKQPNRVTWQPNSILPTAKQYKGKQKISTNWPTYIIPAKEKNKISWKPLSGLRRQQNRAMLMPSSALLL